MFDNKEYMFSPKQNACLHSGRKKNKTHTAKLIEKKKIRHPICQLFSPRYEFWHPPMPYTQQEGERQDQRILHTLCKIRHAAKVTVKYQEDIPQNRKRKALSIQESLVAELRFQQFNLRSKVLHLLGLGCDGFCLLSDQCLDFGYIVFDAAGRSRWLFGCRCRCGGGCR